MPGAGPIKVITDHGILESDPETGEMILTALYPGVTVDEVKAERRLAAEVAGSARSGRTAERAGAAPAARGAGPEEAVSGVVLVITSNARDLYRRNRAEIPRLARDDG